MNGPRRPERIVPKKGGQLLPDLTQIHVVGNAPVGETAGAPVRRSSAGAARTGSAARRAVLMNGGAGQTASCASCSYDSPLFLSGGPSPRAGGPGVGANPSGHQSGHASALQATVKVYCTAVAPCYALPWLRGEESHATGSGFAVILPSGERRLLVQAAVVENHTLVQVRRATHAHKFVAVVEFAGVDVDVAVLAVRDAQFWKDLPALPLPRGLPSIMAEVLVVGFPAGDEISTTRGVVNRILVGGPTRELLVQIDPGVNEGTSGGPVLLPSGALVGMACAGAPQSAQFAGFVIPMPVIHTLLANAAWAAARGVDYSGKSVDTYRVQPLENGTLRAQLGLPARPIEGEDGGVLVTRVPKDAATRDVLLPGDVLLAIDGNPIASDGSVLLPDAVDAVRVGLRYMVQRAPLGSTLRYRVLREGRRVVLEATAAPRRLRLLPPRQPVPQPEWLVLGGLVFTPLLPDYEGFVPKSQLEAIHEPPAFDGQQAVILLRVLQAEINIGYEDICGMLQDFNGTKVRPPGWRSRGARVAQLHGTCEVTERRRVTAVCCCGGR